MIACPSPRAIVAFAVFCLPAGLSLWAQSSASPLPEYTRQDVMIPMRDGVKLHAAILRPVHASGDLPLLMQRTPYGTISETAQRFPANNAELARSQYIFVVEDIRGRYGSEGKFVMMRPLAAHHDVKLYPDDVDESTDAYDTVAWLVQNIPGNNGRVGVFGVSYPGFLATMAGIDPHPAVKAISPQAPMTDVWMADDFFHNGAFRETYGYDYGLGMESSKQKDFAALPAGEDGYDFFLKAGSFANAIAQSPNPSLPTWQAFLTHPAYDSYWQTRGVLPDLKPPALPSLQVGGYWDEEDMWGPQAQYAKLHAIDAKDVVKLVLGPWYHGQWRSQAASLDALDWGEPTGTEFQRDMEAPFFAHYLKDAPMNVANVSSFRTGTNRWMHYDAWPPTDGITQKSLYLGTGQTLSFAKPSRNSEQASADYVSDPAHPIPYRGRPIEATYSPQGSHWYTWLAQDQRPYTSRPDQLAWSTPPLTESVTVTGNVDADLWAATSGSDADWVVKLIDVYPTDPKLSRMAGYQLMVAEEIFRGRYRKSFEQPQAITAHEALEYKWSLHAVDHTFLPGHRLMVEVQSTWFPLYDRNPQTFVPNIMKAQPADYHAASQTIFFSEDHPSHLTLPVASAPAE